MRIKRIAQLTAALLLILVGFWQAGSNGVAAAQSGSSVPIDDSVLINQLIIKYKATAELNSAAEMDRLTAVAGAPAPARH